VIEYEDKVVVDTLFVMRVVHLVSNIMVSLPEGALGEKLAEAREVVKEGTAIITKARKS